MSYSNDYEHLFKNDFDMESHCDINVLNDRDEKSNNDDEFYNLFVDSRKELSESSETHCTSNRTKIFNVNKTPKISKMMRAKAEKIKSMLNQKTERCEEQGYFVMDNKVYVTKENLTPEEKLQIKKIQNRISAQKSRDEQKVMIYNLKIENKKLKDKLAQYEKIISECAQCSSKLHPLSQIITTSSNSNSFSFFTTSLTAIALICLTCMFGIYEFKHSRTGLRVLKETTPGNKTSIVPYVKNVTKRGVFHNKPNNLKLDYEYYGVDDMCTSQKKEDMLEEYLDAKIGKDLNFTSIYENNPKCFNFRMIIPCDFTPEKKEIEPVIAIENSEYYYSMVNKFKKIPYYEIHCNIYNVFKYDNKQCANTFN